MSNSESMSYVSPIFDALKGRPVYDERDWGTPWTEYNPGRHNDTFKPDDYDTYDSTLLAFASCFYFGE